MKNKANKIQIRLKRSFSLIEYGFSLSGCFCLNRPSFSPNYQTFHWISQQSKTEVRNRTQLIIENRPLLFASIKQVFKDNFVANVAEGHPGSGNRVITISIQYGKRERASKKKNFWAEFVHEQCS